jgi:glyoxylase-like metal-dependent hydrolase (beta-lactamase superfamily II)
MPATRPVEGIWSAANEDVVGAPVLPGVWVTALPFPSPLKFSYSYLVEMRDGVVVVDLGCNTDDSWQTFTAGLAVAGMSLDDVRGAVITHIHPDHYGLAPRLKENSAAWIAVHPGERSALVSDEDGATRRISEMARWLVVCGAPLSELDALHADSGSIAAALSKTQPDFDLEDGMAVAGTDGSLLAVHTPGHTPGHSCFLDRERQIVFTGDHVLPRVTPNVSKRPTSGVDPLKDFEASLQRLREFDAPPGMLALPGHEWAFSGLADRLVEMQTHHENRLDEIEAAVRDGAETVWDVALTVAWSRPFTALQPRARRSAVGETYSHLFRLFRSGRVARTPGSPERWSSIRL